MTATGFEFMTKDSGSLVVRYSSSGRKNASIAVSPSCKWGPMAVAQPFAVCHFRFCAAANRTALATAEWSRNCVRSLRQAERSAVRPEPVRRGGVGG